MASSSSQPPAKRTYGATTSKGKGKTKSGSTRVPRMPPGLLVRVPPRLLSLFTFPFVVPPSGILF
eukprot:4066146-Amphidinium_carterae.1